MKYALLVLSLVLSNLLVLAQPEDHPKHEKHYADIEPIETEQLRIEVRRPHSQMNFSEITLRVFNKTDDFIIIKKHEWTFTSQENGYGKQHPAESTVFIEPKGDITRPFKVLGGVGFKVNNLEVIPGGIIQAPAKGEPVETVDFKFKPEKNSMMIGPFAVTVKKWRFNSKELSADFKIRYRGDAVGLVDESKIKIRTESGEVLYNTRAKEKPFVLVPMKTRTATAVRPFDKGLVGKGESVYVVWEEALMEAEGIPLEVPTMKFTYDSEKTKKENK